MSALSAVYKSLGVEEELSFNGNWVGNSLVILAAFPGSLSPVGSLCLAALSADSTACPAGRCNAVLRFKGNVHLNGLYLVKIVRVEHRIKVKINLGHICTVGNIYLKLL